MNSRLSRVHCLLAFKGKGVCTRSKHEGVRSFGAGDFCLRS